MNVAIKEFRPTSQLAPFVECFWEGNFNVDRSALFTQQVVPNGYVELIIHSCSAKCQLFKDGQWSPSPDYSFIGLYTEPYLVKFNDVVKVFGIRFKPEGVYNVFGVPSSLFKSTYENMADVLGNEFISLCEELCNTPSISQKINVVSLYLNRRIEQSRKAFTYVNRAAELIRSRQGMIMMDELSDLACISTRQLERGFVGSVGISPKFYMRLNRLNAVQRKLEENNRLSLTGISHYFGFSDQAHFIREFKNFTGIAPKGFMKNRETFIVNV
jgi:AraC-like DNA-binding protein